MPTTINEALPYPGQGEEPDVAGDVQKLAEAADARIKQLRDKFTVPFGHMGKTNGFQTVGNGGRVVMDAAQILRGGMTFDNAQDALVVPVDGLYKVSGQAYSTGTGWGIQIMPVYCKPASGAAEYQTGVNARYRKDQDADSVGAIPVGTLDLKAGDKLFLVGFYTGSVDTWGASGWNGTYLEVEYFQP